LSLEDSYISWKKFDFFRDKIKYKVPEGKAGVREAYDQMASHYDNSKHLYWTRKMEKGEELHTTLMKSM